MAQNTALQQPTPSYQRPPQPPPPAPVKVKTLTASVEEISMAGSIQRKFLLKISGTAEPPKSSNQNIVAVTVSATLKEPSKNSQSFKDITLTQHVGGDGKFSVSTSVTHLFAPAEKGSVLQITVTAGGKQVVLKFKFDGKDWKPLK